MIIDIFFEKNAFTFLMHNTYNYRPMLLVIAICCVSLRYADAYRSFQDVIPNGNNIPHPCKANYIWHGVGHENALGGGKRNAFGTDFANAGQVNLGYYLCEVKY